MESKLGLTKQLNKEIATSILIEVALMREHNELVVVASNRENIYFHVNNTNTCIMHVEDDFCILVDNMVSTYADEDGKKVSLPRMLSASHYGVYQETGNTSRDWVRNTATGKIIGYDIKELIHGNGCKLAGYTLDHKFETYDEREKAKEFSDNNVNRGSHRRKVEIKTKENLDRLIKRIQENEYEKGGLYME